MDYATVLNKVLARKELELTKDEQLMAEIGSFNNTHVWTLGGYMFIDTLKAGVLFKSLAKEFGKEITTVLEQYYTEKQDPMKERKMIGGKVVYGNVYRIKM